MRTRRHGWGLGVQGMGAGRVPHLAIRHNAPGLTKACRRGVDMTFDVKSRRKSSQLVFFMVMSSW
jgi:hypothetical protein